MSEDRTDMTTYLTDEEIAAMLDGESDVPDIDDLMDQDDSDSAGTDDQAGQEDVTETTDQDGDETGAEEGTGDDEASGDDVDDDTDGDDAGQDSEDDGGEKPTDDTDDEPVVLAKDGKHVIPYSELKEAREQAKALREVIEKQTSLIEQLRQDSTAADDKSDEELASSVADMTDEEFKEFQEDYPEVAKRFTELNKQIKALVEQQQKIVETTQQKDHFATILEKHPDAAHIANSDEFKSWVESARPIDRANYERIIKSGSAEEVIDLLDAYKETINATDGDKSAEGEGEKIPAKKAKAAAEKAAEKAEQKGKSKMPNTLSDIPGGAAHHDEAEALTEMSPMSLMEKLDGKTPDQIEALLNRIM